MIMMTFQYAMGQMSVSQQLNRASEMFFQPFGRHFRIGMIIQRFVYASNGFYVLKYRANVVTYQNDCSFSVDFFQKFV